MLRLFAGISFVVPCASGVFFSVRQAVLAGSCGRALLLLCLLSREHALIQGSWSGEECHAVVEDSWRKCQWQ